MACCESYNVNVTDLWMSVLDKYAVSTTDKSVTGYT